MDAGCIAVPNAEIEEICRRSPTARNIQRKPWVGALG